MALRENKLSHSGKTEKEGEKELPLALGREKSA